ncbi:hypothetical protein N1F78_12545 [Seonamhaeicola sp. MEBiC1930]|uniref:transglutaminase domain-containing protein n=1 Tax=Seonamhaeicola sp. MEBiC01930 TaxID=2976768 RepID=UPI00324D5E26
MKIEFEKADNIAKSLNKETLKNLPVLVYQLTSNLDTDVEKFRAIYTWISLNIKSDYPHQLQNLKMRKKFLDDSISLNLWNTKFREKTLKRLIKNKKTICTGYAYLLEELASLAGLNCKMIHGYGRNVSANIDELSQPNHSWNAVLLNNKWYLSDPTWSSGFFNVDEGVFVHDYNSGYFLADPSLFVKSHYPLDSKWVLMDEFIPTIQDFLTGPLVYGDAFKYSILPLEPEKMKSEINKGDKQIFRFIVPEEAKSNQIRLVIDSGSHQNKIDTYSYNQETEILEFMHTFSNRGLFDIHLQVNNTFVVTYAVKVIKPKS